MRCIPFWSILSAQWLRVRPAANIKRHGLFISPITMTEVRNLSIHNVNCERIVEFYEVDGGAAMSSTCSCPGQSKVIEVYPGITLGELMTTLTATTSSNKTADHS